MLTNFNGVFSRERVTVDMRVSIFINIWRLRAETQLINAM